MIALPYVLLGLGALHLWALRQRYLSAAAGNRPGLVREQPWARGWFPAAAGFFNGWMTFSLLDAVFLKPYGHWQMPVGVQTVGDILFLIAAVALTMSYTLWHLFNMARAVTSRQLKFYHSLHGLTGLLVLGSMGYLMILSRAC